MSRFPEQALHLAVQVTTAREGEKLMSFRRLVHCLLSGRPYFGSAHRARQGVIDRHRYFLPLIEAARNGRRGSIRVLEVGSWAGASAVSWAKALEGLDLDGTVLCVDRWTPYFDTTRDTERVYSEMNEAASSGEIFSLFLHNIEACGVRSRVEYCVGDSRQVLPTLPSGSFDVVFLDGSHEFESMRFDVKEGARLTADGGILCGDDLELQRDEVESADHAVAVSSSCDYVYSNSRKCWYHPGVTEAVAAEFGRVSVWNGLWACRRRGNDWARVELRLEGAVIPQHLRDDLEAEERDQRAVFWEGERCPARVELIGETAQYNIVQAGRQYLAVCKALGPVDLFRERLGERELGGLILYGSSVEEARRRGEEAETAAATPAVSLIAETNDYNIIRAGARFVAVAKSLGPLQLFRERLGERQIGTLILVGSSLEDVQARVAGPVDGGALGPEGAVGGRTVEPVDE